MRADTSPRGPFPVPCRWSAQTKTKRLLHGINLNCSAKSPNPSRGPRTHARAPPRHRAPHACISSARSRASGPGSWALVMLELASTIEVERAVSERSVFYPLSALSPRDIPSSIPAVRRRRIHPHFTANTLLQFARCARTTSAIATIASSRLQRSSSSD